MIDQNTDFPPDSGKDAKKTYRTLGPLETELMEAIWNSEGPLSVQGIIDRLDTAHNYKTVMTVLNRLVDKLLLGRSLDGRAYHYFATESRQSFLRSVAEGLVSDYVNLYGGSSAQFLADAIDTKQPRNTLDDEHANFWDYGRETKNLQKNSLITLVLAALILQVVSSIFRPRKKRK
tara:strand:- start:6385 stop:6912 length:528 start_codon:yes stop_codon:yes gene_type:complete